MKTKRLQIYLEKNKVKANPLKKQEDVLKNPDNKIDQDFSGFPHGHANEKIINPKTVNEQKIAEVNYKDGEKISSKDNH